MTNLLDIREVEVLPNADDSNGRIELEDDEQILTAEWRGSHRLVLAVASPTTYDRCVGLTADDLRCKRDATEDSNYCSLHMPEEDD